MHNVDVYLGLGSNMSKPKEQLKSALHSLSQLPGTELIRCSSFYKSQPMGPQDQPEYVNAVALIQTELSPYALLSNIQGIELQHGRTRKADRWGPRTLDIDILLYGQDGVNEEDLIIPHYGMKTREFVLYPLFELAPGLVLPDGDKLSELVEKCPLKGMEKL